MKNIVFDFGNVIITFNEDEIISKFTKDPKAKEFLIKYVINSPEWVGNGLLDTGYLSKENAADIINDRTNNEYKDLTKEFLINHHHYMYIQNEIIEIIKKLKAKGYKIYMLSNTTEDTYEEHIKNIEYLFDGIVLSYRIHHIKPNNAIYEELINKYNIDPKETLFIDDREDNMQTANKYGIKGRKVNKNDVEDIKQVLKEYGIGD